MISIVLLCVISILLYKLYSFMVYKPSNFPPGPIRLPFMGCYPLLWIINYNHFQQAISYLCKLYKSNVVGMYYANSPMIVAHDAESVKAMLTDPLMDGRCTMELALIRDPNYIQRGIFFTDGDLWKDQRRFSLRHMRDFGFGRRFIELEKEINDDIMELLDIIKNPKYPHEKEIVQNGNVLAPHIFSIIPCNVLMQLFINHRHSREEQYKLLQLTDCTTKFQRAADAYGNIFSCLPWMGKLFPGWTKHSHIKNKSHELYFIMKNIVDEQIRTFDESYERHFLDRYIKIMKEAEKHNKNSFFEYKQLIMICVDYMLPNQTSLPVALQTLFQLLLLNPEKLKLCQDEIDRCIPRGRLPNLDDRVNLDYVEATLRESMRIETPVASSVIHRAMYDTSLMGYDIPANTICVPAIHEAHMDEKVWHEPKKFMPERMLDENGKLSLKKDKSIPFGAGKRLCVAETYSRNFMFLLTTSILQNFDISIPKEHPLPGLKDIQSGVIRIPPNFWFKCTPR